MSLRALLQLGDEEKERRGVEFVPREIARQPETWRATLRTCAGLRGALEKFLSEAGVPPRPHLAEKERLTIVLLGAGTSAYAGSSLASLFRTTSGCETRVLTSPDLLTHAREVLVTGHKYFFISFSRSGMSPETVAVARRLADDWPDARHLAITCNRDGLIAKEFAQHPRVMCLVLDEEVNDQALAMTSSFSNMVVAGQYAATVSAPATYERTLDALATAAERFLETASEAAENAAGAPVERVCFLASGALLPIAQESALKVLEMTAGRVVTLAESFLGVRHGPLSFVDGATLVVAHLSADARVRAFELDLVEELRNKKLAHAVVAVTPAGDARACALVDAIVPLELGGVADVYRPPIDVIFGQLLSLHLSLRCGLLPDAPSSSGAIHRVVSGVRI
jgi:tagatose-6-phosphate ketose/aldose isomerase